MTGQHMRRISLEEARAMKDRGETRTDPNAHEGPELPEGFWDDAVLVAPDRRSVHLKLDADVFDFFQRGGKGHITRMQNVLKAYVKAQAKRTG